MSAIVLCEKNRAQGPYELKSARRRVYSLIELCYYIYSNVLVCDEELLKPELYEWIREECGYGDLYASLNEIRKTGKDAHRIAASIFAYTDFLTKQEREAVCERIRKAAMLSVSERRKSRADLLFLDSRFEDALREYADLLKAEKERDNRFSHNLKFDIGCCYGRLFYFDMAFDYFKKASESTYADEKDTEAMSFCERMLREE